MRKTYAQIAYEKAARDFKSGASIVPPMRAVQELLGHAEAMSTQNYLSFIVEDLGDECFPWEVREIDTSKKKQSDK